MKIQFETLPPAEVPVITLQAVAEMRGWIADCAWQDLDEETELSAVQVVRGVRRHYAGGVEQFLKDSAPQNFERR